MRFLRHGTETKGYLEATAEKVSCFAWAQCNFRRNMSTKIVSQDIFVQYITLKTKERQVNLNTRWENHMRVDQTNILEAIQKNTKENQVGNSVVPTAKSQTAKSDETGSVTVNMSEATYGNPQKEEKTFLDQLEESMSMDTEDRKNQMTILSQTTTPEDYKEMEKDGFSLNSTDSHTVVTVTDKIKASMARGGADVSYGDGLSEEALAAVTGSEAVAAQIAKSLESADLPANDENMDDALEAYDQAAALAPMNDGSVKYMLDNRLEPSISNLYKAEYSGSNNYNSNYTGDIDFSSLQGQIEQTITNAGLEVNEQTIADSQWMIQNQIPFTADNLAYLEQLKSLQLPADTDKIISAMTTAVAEGMRPSDGMLLPGYSIKDQAEHAVEIIGEASDEDLAYIIEHDMELTIGNLEEAKQHRGENKGQQGGVAGNTTVTGTATGSAASSASSSQATNGQPATAVDGEYTEDGAYTAKGLSMLMARRQLEETRLAMTSEANISLIKQGISINTESLEQLVEQLKTAETSYYAHLLEASGVEASAENVSLFAETTTKVDEMAKVPAYVLGMQQKDISTINTVHEAGTALQDTFEKANESYETLMTAPRADLGDSIQKAFQNVDDILKDLGLDTTEANQRAVRILAYNNTEITPDTIAQMKAGDEEVQRVFAGLTPKVVIQMIKEGVNPLDMDFAKLNQAIGQIKEEIDGNDDEKFSKYLWKLEQNSQISEEERSSYIGIYRLIAQVEKTDGAAIGSLLNKGTELTMRNLLTEVRTSRHGNVDVKVDDSFGEIEELNNDGISITDQVEAAYQTNCVKDVLESMTPSNLQQLLSSDEWMNLTPEQLKEAIAQASTDETALEQEYYQEQLQNLETCNKASQEVYDMLERYDIPNTVLNVLAADEYTKNRNQGLRKLFGEYENKDGVDQSDLEEIKEEILERFGEAVKTPKDMAEAQETLAEVAEHALENMVKIDDNVSTVDLKAMQLVNAQMSIFTAKAKEENYAIPVIVNGQTTNVELKIVRGTKKKGMVDVLMDIDRMGKVAAKFQAKEDGISGLIATDDEATRNLLADHMGLLASTIQENGAEAVDVRCAVVSDLDLDRFAQENETVSHGMGNLTDSTQTEDSTTDDANNEDTYEIQTSRLYHIAESFIRVMKEIA